LIEQAYQEGETLGLAVWCEDEAGPYQTKPYAGQGWYPEGHPQHYPHEYARTGTAKIMTLFHPHSGQVHVKGTTSTINDILHPWMQAELETIVAQLPKKEALADPTENRAEWLRWQTGLETKITLPQELPRLRMLLILDNLSGHKSVALVLWLFAHGIMPLYTPLGGSWLNMAESIQRILKKRALEGSHPRTENQIMTWFETVARHWNADPTPFIWGGKRQRRRQRARQRRLHRLGGSGAYTRRPVRRKWQAA
jgi:transposase